MIKTVTLVPTLMTDDKQVYRNLVEAFNTFTRRVQIDVTDDEFTPNRTLDITNVWWPNEWQADLHFMALYPSKYIDTIVRLHPSLCILHAEANEDLTPTFAKLKEAGIKTGLALLPQTYPGNVKQYLETIDHVLIFAGKLGQQGAGTDLMQMEKIPLIRELRPTVEIGWDGGANMSNIRALSHAGIDVINVGAAISKSNDPANAFRTLKTEIDKNGVVL